MECINDEQQQSQTEPLDVKLEQAEEKTESHYSMPQIAGNIGGGQQVQVRPTSPTTFNSEFHFMVYIVFSNSVDSSNARGNFVLT